MKKALVLALVAVFSMVAMASAATVSFSWGANFVTASNAGLGTSVGTATQLNWYADDFGYGVRTENNTIQVGVTNGNANVTEITIDKWLSNSVAVGLGIGSLSTVQGTAGFWSVAATYPAVDVRGTVKLLSGKGEKVNASLDFNVAARFCNTGALTAAAAAVATPKLDGTVATLAVTLGL